MNYIKYFGAFLCLSLTMMTAGCSMSDDLECPPDPSTGSGTGKAYVQLSFTMPGGQGTRANSDPDGGENGDGAEAGQSFENEVNSAVAFLFKHSDEGVNADGTTTVIPVGFTSLSGSGTTWTTVAQQVPDLDYGEYDVIVVANPGDMGITAWWRTVNTLDQVRNHIQHTAWKKVNGSFSNFLMASADDADPIELTTENTTPQTAATTTVNVERMAARVDYKALNEYTCEDKTYNGAKVEIIGATIINRLTAGSYLLKRVADDVYGKNLEYLGDERPLGINVGAQENYVIDPWTALKTTENLTGDYFTVDDILVPASELYDEDTYLPNGSDNPEDWSGYCKKGFEVIDPDKTNEVWQCIGYTLENTTDGGMPTTTLRNYCTGIVFKAQFHPVGLGENYQDGQTFFSYDGTLYATLTDMMNEWNERDDFTSYIEGKINDAKTYADIKNLADGLFADHVGYKDYLLQFVGENNDNESLTTKPHNWTDYMANELGVVEDASKGSQINQNKVETRAKLYDLSNKRLRTYYQGECYYLWWLRHSNDDNDNENGLMEYAVVRNNIYKVNVESVYSLGGDIPDTEGLRVTVHVKRWNSLPPEELPM